MRWRCNIWICFLFCLCNALQTLFFISVSRIYLLQLLYFRILKVFSVDYVKQSVYDLLCQQQNLACYMCAYLSIFDIALYLLQKIQFLLKYSSFSWNIP